MEMDDAFKLRGKVLLAMCVGMSVVVGGVGWGLSWIWKWGVWRGAGEVGV